MVFLPPGSFGTWIMARLIRDAGNTADVTFAEAGTLPYLTRIHAVDTVAITTRLPTGVFPTRNTAHAMEILRRFTTRLDGERMAARTALGYIVPRIQALAMNEAARIVEEGVASAEDVGKATKYGFGFRFAMLGLPQFIGWGGGDILFHASNYNVRATGQDRFTAPQIIRDNMENGRNGLRDGKGFLNYEGLDIPAYQRDRLGGFVAMLRHLDKMPPKG